MHPPNPAVELQHPHSAPRLLRLSPLVSSSAAFGCVINHLMLTTATTWKELSSKKASYIVARAANIRRSPLAQASEFRLNVSFFPRWCAPLRCRRSSGVPMETGSVLVRKRESRSNIRQGVSCEHETVVFIVFP